MPPVALSLESAHVAELDYVESLLRANGLPASDVRGKPNSFYVASVGGDRVGIGGLESAGTAGLLRSIVIEENARGMGYGSAICDRLEGIARESDIDELYLLTTTAAPFFEARGYERIDRADAPPEIRDTDEFADLCPDSATCMRLTL